MFYLSKILWGIFQPSSLILILFAAGGIFAVAGRVRTAMRLFVSGTGRYVLFGFSSLANWPPAPLGTHANAVTAKVLRDAAGIIVLGGAIEGRPGAAFERRRRAYDRGSFPSLPVVFTGGPDAVFSRNGFSPKPPTA